MTRTADQLRQIAGQSRRRAEHCPQCSYPLNAGDEPKLIGGRFRQCCSGHTRKVYVKSHAETLLLLAAIADELIAEKEGK